MKKAAIVTYGCQMNINDSSKIKKVMIDDGYEIVESIKDADVIILNTCTVREGASEKVYGKLGELKRMKKDNKDLVIGVAGCLAQEKKNEIIEENPHVDLVIGNQNIHKMAAYIKKINDKTLAHIVAVDNEDVLPPRIDAEFDSSITAFVSITYGCNNFCSYCIVPYVRGRERSVPLADVVNEVKSYIDKGYKEIVLLGQNVNSYGMDFATEDGVPKDNFAKLLREICKIQGKFRVRFMSPHPRDFTDELIEVIAGEEKICKSIHIPLQAGSTEVLKKMNRGYSKEKYMELVDKIRRNVENAALSADIIVGFPGETENDFLDTLDVVKYSRYDSAYMFMYSKRDGTPAAGMEEQISDSEKSERLQRLLALQNEVSRSESEKYMNKTLEILVEGPTEKNEENYTGRTDTNKIVIIKANKDYIGEFVKVRITEARTWTLYGEVVEDR